jgi:N-acetyl sugar amidotransferase
MKAAGRGRDYDCIVGVSGGVDSTFVAWKVKSLGLRALAVHFDSGWNSELAVANIENLVKRLDLDLVTYVVDWEEMRDLQLAFFKASVANCDIPTDHGLMAVLYQTAWSKGLRWVVSGHNVATELILPVAWGHDSRDSRHLRTIHARFGRGPLRTFPVLGFLRGVVIRRAVRVFPILDFLDYDKAAAKEHIARELGWRDYGGKHFESVFTRFFQSYYLPRKFGYDKRRAHLSSLIVSGQMTREAALQELEHEPYPLDKMIEDRDFVAKKLGVSPKEFEEIMARPNRTYRDYASNAALLRAEDLVLGHLAALKRRLMG